MTGFRHKLHLMLENRFPEKRLFLRSDEQTRFIRLGPATQLTAWSVTSLVLAWTIVATAIVIMDSIGAGNFRAQALRDQMTYEDRLNVLSSERDRRATEARAAQDRFSSALEQISLMQSELLRSEERRRELETGIEVIQASLRRTMSEREAARDRARALEAALDDGNGTLPGTAGGTSSAGTVDMLADALAQTARERDQIAADAEYALEHASEMELELRLLREKNDAIFSQLEEAFTVSVEPLNKMFRAAGMDPEQVLDTVRSGYSGTGGPLTPLQFSTRGGSNDPDAERANSILRAMDRLNMYRLAAEKVPFDMPVKAGFRFTSGYGMRWGRMHNGTDFAAPVGTPIYAPAEGVVTFAGWSSGYGRMVKIRHAFGIETRYAHQSRIRVEEGQRVSRGDHIGDIGNSGRSTGPHLHYEIRQSGSAVNPMTYIRAGQDVF
ncbi:M23 family metallopeptidase [Salibaculum sp.]|uniref:M23 family metallopeptidase n=1 Tax=Salibaculum sp. TaxID=2855480 RepID=UPI002B47A0AD|nr:M23 family metallopeptidase [Salibaculum sp.]HKL70400.1 M23 family metallopeptidase [Salibaculum sp.]